MLQETIRIELKPPDPPLASLDEFSGAEAVPPVALGTVVSILACIGILALSLILIAMVAFTEYLERQR